jgi:hypothetical protein
MGTDLDIGLSKYTYDTVPRSICRAALEFSATALVARRRKHLCCVESEADSGLSMDGMWVWVWGGCFII